MRPDGFTTLIAIVLLSLTFTCMTPCESNEWIPYVPSKEQVDIKWSTNDHVNITVTITFPHSGFTVHWGPIVRLNDVARAYIQVFMWTGPSAQVITLKSYTWMLPGDVRIFELYANGVLIDKVRIASKLNEGIIVSWAIALTALAVAIVVVLKLITPRL